jgi:hypothetical protein
MQETSQNIEHLNKRIKDLEVSNLDLNVKNEASLKKTDELQAKVNELSKVSVDDVKKIKDEV